MEGTPAPYLQGIHLVATLVTSQTGLIKQYTGFQLLIDKLIAQHRLCKLGEVYHNFSPAGFTAVVCLSESHLSVHTWPEFGLINTDIYLSNFSRNNDAVVHNIYEEILAFFKATVQNEQTLRR